MPNFVQLGQGLQNVGTSFREANNFLSNQRQLDISQQNADTNTDSQKLAREEYAEKQRQTRNLESSRMMMSTLTQLANTTDDNGNPVPVNQALDSNPAARDSLIKSLVHSNHDYNAAVGNKEIRHVPIAGGKYGIETKNADGTWAPVVANGAPVQFDSNTLLFETRKEMAANGLAELIYMDKENDKAHKAGKIDTDTWRAKATEIVQAKDNLQGNVEKVGIDSHALADQVEGAKAKAVTRADAEQSSDNPGPMSEAQLAVYQAKQPKLGEVTDPNVVEVDAARRAAGGTGAPTPQNGRFRIEPGVYDNSDKIISSVSSKARMDAGVGDRMDALQGDIDRFNDPAADGVQKLGAGLGAAYDSALLGAGAIASPVVDAAKTTASGLSGAIKSLSKGFKGQPGPKAEEPKPINPHTTESTKTTATETAAKAPTAAAAAQQAAADVQARAATKTITPTEKTMVVNRSIRQMSAMPAEPTAYHNKLAAYNYANGMVIMGQKPDPQILANLDAGDNMRGDGLTFTLERAKFQLEEVKFQHDVALEDIRYDRAVKVAEIGSKARLSKENDPTGSKWSGIMDKSVDNVAVTDGAPGMKGKAEADKKLKADIHLAITENMGSLAMMGLDPTNTDNPVQVAWLTAKMARDYVVIKQRAGQQGWLSKTFGSATQVPTFDDMAAKYISLANPEAGTQAIRVAASRNLHARYPDGQISPEIYDAEFKRIQRDITDPESALNKGAR